MLKLKSIRQTITLKAEPINLFRLLLDSKKIGAITGSKTSISKKVNGKFILFDGYCNGYNMELIEGKKIVQAWCFEEDGWPDDHYSICTIFFAPLKNDKITLSFNQIGVPAHKHEALKMGWKEYYWEPIKDYLKIGSP